MACVKEVVDKQVLRGKVVYGYRMLGGRIRCLLSCMFCMTPWHKCTLRRRLHVSSESWQVVFCFGWTIMSVGSWGEAVAHGSVVLVMAGSSTGPRGACGCVHTLD